MGHILPIVPMDKTVPYKSGMKDEGTQNIRTVRSFYMRFTWIWSGWEGSAHGWILKEASRRQTTTFPHTPQGINWGWILWVQIIVATFIVTNK